jgi:ABC-type multidrug transport system ATPase subunit
MSFVALDKVRLELGGRRILDDLSFEVAAGESVALTGANGSGKTSILRCLLGLVPFAGRALVGGHDVVADPIAARSLIGYLPQKPAFGDARADEALRFIARVRRLDPARIAPVLETVGLAAHARERVRTFSGGMQQRLSLAIALYSEAPLLLFDEPTASLDHEGQRTFAEVVARLRREGRTLLLASHRPEEIHALTDRVLALDAGRLVESEHANVIALRGARR